MKWPVIVMLLVSATASAAYPTSFSNAKSKAEKEVYFDHLQTFYCGCDYVFDDIEDLDGDGNKHETMINPLKCGYTPRNPKTKRGKINQRASRIEWEHIMPAHLFGGQLDEWVNKHNHPECKKNNGKFISGRDCAYKLNPAFKKAHDDLNNLVPAVGELNGDRSNYDFAVIDGEERIYGHCDFEVDFEHDLAEPADDVKGDVARVYFYMIEAHQAQVDDDTLALMRDWSLLDPVSAWECERNRRIEAAQGVGNRYVFEQCTE
ncbi:endonuclease [Neiella sp. HB171785]|uniref:Endonuclease n=1 Tax=Neiella litorisoli TaxID=2771431 RepID=A0A8J6QUR5_9GAMM|nr:endonuclease [Neiella litorisoli]MBD1389398.1 endonuclease [Neiella litorisoli]